MLLDVCTAQTRINIRLGPATMVYPLYLFLQLSFFLLTHPIASDSEVKWPWTLSRGEDAAGRLR